MSINGSLEFKNGKMTTNDNNIHRDVKLLVTIDICVRPVDFQHAGDSKRPIAAERTPNS